MDTLGVVAEAPANPSEFFNVKQSQAISLGIRPVTRQGEDMSNTHTIEAFDVEQLAFEYLAKLQSEPSDLDRLIIARHVIETSIKLAEIAGATTNKTFQEVVVESALAKTRKSLEDNVFGNGDDLE